MTDAEYNELRERLEEQAAETNRLVAMAAGETNVPRLKLFTCRVLYAERSNKHSWFTLLDVDETSAKKACIKQVHALNRYGPSRGAVGTIEVTEIEGPFQAGQILHSEQ